MRVLLCAILSTFFATAAYAQEHGTFLYMVERAGYENSFLIGTMHMGQPGSDIPMGLKAIMLSSSCLIVETNKDEIPAGTASDISYSMMDLKNPLSGKIGNRYVRQLTTQLDEDTNFVEKLKPWAVLMYMGDTLPSGYSKDYGIDDLLIRTAKVLEKDIVGLEGVESVNMYTHLPEDKVIPAIRHLSDNFERDLKLAENAAKHYYANDVSSLKNLLDRSNKDFPDYQFWDKWDEEMVLKRRNLAWMPKIEDQLRKGSAVIAVGTAHLYGENGIVLLLQQRGFKVTPMVDNNRQEY
jgi:uncharacterized protein YbaP (TraB family)